MLGTTTPGDLAWVPTAGTVAGTAGRPCPDSADCARATTAGNAAAINHPNKIAFLKARMTFPDSRNKEKPQDEKNGKGLNPCRFTSERRTVPKPSLR
ncbi:hypothetical protein WJ973_04865 [Achromobacter xylosoxidans]